MKISLLAVCIPAAGWLASCTNAPSSSKTPAPSSDTVFHAMFDGSTLTGWVGDTSFWKVADGAIAAEETPAHGLKTNSFLIYRDSVPSDFEFEADYRISPGGNSGVQYRSTVLDSLPWAMKGYQLDIDGANVYTGQNYEERGRGFLAMRGQVAVIGSGGKPVIAGSLGNPDSLKQFIKPNDWNSLHLIVRGNHMLHLVNGIPMSETTDNDTLRRKFTGSIGLQLHVMDSMKVEYRNLRLRRLNP